MSFFPPDPPQDDVEEMESDLDPRQHPPEDQLPAIFPISEILGIGESVAIIAVEARVYANGVEFVLERRMRRAGRSEQEWQQAQMGFHSHPGSSIPGRLRYGIALGDGQQLFLDGTSFSPEDVAAHTGHFLSPTRGSGSGSNRYYTSQDGLWLWPLPPEGPLELVMKWPEHDLPESRIVIDTAPLRALAAQARPIWTDSGN